jgi:hypothetical protein
MMSDEFVTCPNPACGQRLPAHAKWCKFCGTVLGDAVAGATSSDSAAAATLARDASAPPPAWPELVPQPLSGVINGVALLTPESVQSPSGPGALTPRAELKVDFNLGSTLLQFSTRGNTQLGVYRGGLTFPALCAATNAPAEAQVLIEAAVLQTGLGKVTFPNMPAALLNRVSTALTANRYWFRVAFAPGHGLKDRAVSFSACQNSGSRNTGWVRLTNRAYAREFAQLNQLTNTRWLTAQHLLWQALGAGAAVIGLGVLLGGWFARSQGGSSGAGSTLLLVFGALALVGGIVLLVKGTRGEPL